MQFNFIRKYASSNSHCHNVNFKLSCIPDGFVPFALVNMAPKSNYAWNMANSSGRGSRVSGMLKDYIKTYNNVYEECKSEIHEFIAPTLDNNYYFNYDSMVKSGLSGYFNNGISGHRDIMNCSPINGFETTIAVSKGFLGYCNGSNRVTKTLCMLMIKKDYISILKLNLLLGKSIDYTMFEVWINDEVLDSKPLEAFFKGYLLNSLSFTVAIRYKSNMSSLISGFKQPVLDTLAAKREWLVNQELRLRNSLYGEFNPVKEYPKAEELMISDSEHISLKPKEKKIVVELID